jgi:hypothetical protein
MKKKRIAFLLIGGVLLLVGVISVFVFISGDSWKLKAVEAIQSRVNTELVIGAVDISIWSEFPMISVDLLDIKILESNITNTSSENYLLEAGRLGVMFSLWEVIFGEPIIRSLALEAGRINLSEFIDGSWNTQVLVPRNDSTSTFSINSIEFIDIDLSAGLSNGDNYQGHISHSEITESSVVVSFDDLLINGLATATQPLYGYLEIDIEGELSAGLTAIIQDGVVNDLSVIGVVNINPEFQWTAECKINRITIQKLETLLNDPQLIRGFSYDGAASVSIDATPKVMKLDVHFPEAHFALAPSITGLSMNKTGRVSSELHIVHSFKSSTTSLQIKSLNANSNGLILAVSGATADIKSNALSLAGTAELDLSSKYTSWVPSLSGPDMIALPNSGVIKLSGRMSISPSSTFAYEDISIECEHLSGALNSSPYTLDNIRLGVKSDKLEIDNINYNWAGNIGVFQASINSLSRVVEGGEVKGNVGIDAESIVIDSIMSWWENLSDTEETDDIVFLPHGSRLAYQINSTNLYWDGLECRAFNALGNITPKKVKITHAKIEGLSGSARVDGSVRVSGPGLIMGLSGTTTDISVKDLFRTYNNFGQTVLRAEHLKGMANVAGTIHLGWDKSGEFLYEEIGVDLDVSISNGRLRGLEMFNDVADYLKAHRLVAPLVDPEDLRSRLSDIEFDYLESPIRVAGSVTEIPFLNIHSSAMGVSIEGMHEFSGKINYTLGFALRDLKDNKQGDFGDIQDDGLGNMFFLSMDGTLDLPEYGYDRSAAREHRRKSIAAEVERIKNSLRGEGTDEKESPESESPENEEEEEVKSEPAEEKKTKSKQRNNNNQPSSLDDEDDEDF